MKLKASAKIGKHLKVMIAFFMSEESTLYEVHVDYSRTIERTLLATYFLNGRNYL